jgi:hypothetical protein
MMIILWLGLNGKRIEQQQARLSETVCHAVWVDDGHKQIAKKPPSRQQNKI